MLVSVIIAAFNEEKYISRCIRSLISQSLPSIEFEIIVVDDGSSDKTISVLSQFSQRIELIQNHVNKGLPFSVNRGIRKAKSDLVVRVDADDYVNSEFLISLVNKLKEIPYNDAVASDYLLVNDDEEVLAEVSAELHPIACGILFQKQHLENIGLYHEEFLRHEDKELRSRFDKIYKVGYLNQYLYRYRQHPNNITKDKVLMKHFASMLDKQ